MLVVVVVVENASIARNVHTRYLLPLNSPLRDYVGVRGTPSSRRAGGEGEGRQNALPGLERSRAVASRDVIRRCSDAISRQGQPVG